MKDAINELRALDVSINENENAGNESGFATATATATVNVREVSVTSASYDGGGGGGGGGKDSSTTPTSVSSYSATLLSPLGSTATSAASSMLHTPSTRSVDVDGVNSVVIVVQLPAEESTPISFDARAEGPRSVQCKANYYPTGI